MRRAGLVALAVLVLASALAACGGEREGEPAPPAAPDARALSIETSDGVRLSARLFEAASEGRIAILAHQYGADQSSWYAAAERLRASGVSALTFDFRGFGQSAGDEDPAALATDLQAVVAAARDRGYERVLLLGASMGGTASIAVAGMDDDDAAGIDGVIALSAPSEFGPLNAEAAVASMRAPLLVVAGRRDTSANDSLLILANAARVTGANRLVVDAAAHGTALLDSREATTVWQAIARFIDAIWPDRAVGGGADPGY